MHLPKLTASCLLAGSVLLMSGCLINSSSKSYQSGTPIARQTLAQIKPGDSPEFVIATLGEPKSKKDLGDGAELWKWEYTRRQTSSGSVLFLFAGASEKETHSATYVHLRDGRVERAWQD